MRTKNRSVGVVNVAGSPNNREEEQWDNERQVRLPYSMGFRQYGLLSRRRSPESYKFFSSWEFLPRARKLSARVSEAASHRDPRVAMPSAASLDSSWINYTLMRGNVLPIVKVRAGWRVSALRSRGISRGILVKFHSARVAKSAVSRTVSRVSIRRFKLQLDGSRAGYPSEVTIVYTTWFYSLQWLSIYS